MKKVHLVIFFSLLSNALLAQRGKDGAKTVSTANIIVNEYTALTADAAAGATSITVAASGLNTNSRFSAGLAPGDLVMIIQMQGATISGSLVGVAGVPNDATWGSVVSYNNCGNYEYKEVASVPNSTSITFTCALEKSYTTAGKAQIVRIPRYTTLTVNSPGSITGQAWDGNTGGIVAIETLTSATINSGAAISANGIGFRGGITTDNNDYFGGGFYSAIDDGEGSVKGEGIAGYLADYDPYGGRYCRGAAANAGGGGTAHNTGGGGGANGGTVSAWNGNGNPDNTNAGWTNAWNQEAAGFSSNTSSGGGRGGYSFSNNDLNATTAAGAPGQSGWGGDNRTIRGGLGGRPLDYSTGRIFMGGGGGSGDQNDGDGGAGGNGGGIVYLISYGTVTGSGNINANGQNGVNSDNSGPSITGYAGIDGAGGAGGGGTVIINSSGNITTLTVNANGGTGGNQNFSHGAFASATYNPAYGPGGGGGGGYVAISNGTITRNTNGGANGTTNSSGLTEFPPNGATKGGAGTNNASQSNYYLDVPNDTVTICSTGTATFTASIMGSAPGGATIYWYDTPFGSATVGMGTSFTTPTLSSNTTYYAGICPGSYRIPVVVIVGGPSINSSGISINDASCAGNDGSITGIVVTGATSYSWNGTSSPNADLSNATPGSYTLSVSDGSCTATAGPFTIGSAGGPVIDDSGINITDASCAGGDGSITGIIVTGATSYSWNGNTSPNADLSNANSGSYTLSVSDGSGCTVTSGPYTVGTAGGPIVNTSGMTVTATTCGLNNGSITGITASGAGTITYQWNGTTASGPDTIALSAGNYTLVITDGSGCSATVGPLTINSSSAPAIDISSMAVTDATCGINNGSITGITVSGGQSPYTYTWNSINATSADTSSLGAGSYTLVVTDLNGCTATQPNITVNSSGGATIDDSNVTVTGTTCGLNNGSITGIMISGGTNPVAITYNGTSYPSADVSNLPSGSYTLQVTDGSGCVSSSGPYDVLSSSSPTASATGTDVTCNGLNDGSATASATGGSGAYTYQWTGGPTSAAYNNLSAGTYEVVVTDNLGCSDTATVTINEPAPLGATISGNTTICAGQSTTLTASGGILHVWSTSETTASITVTPAVTTTYTVVVSDGTCTDTATVDVTVNAVPVASISGDTVLCPNESTTLTASGGTTYLWSTGETTSSISYTPSGSGSVYVIATNNCGNDTSTVSVTLNTAPNADAGNDITISLGNGTTLTAQGGTSFDWSPGTGLNCVSCQSPFANPAVTTTYTVTVTDANGCTATDDVTVTVETIFSLFIPDAFSPNGDGHNDILYVRGNGFSEFKFRLYDRWGQMIFSTTDLALGWDGTFNNKPLNDGVFVYTLEGTYLDGSSFSQKGNISLHR